MDLFKTLQQFKNIEPDKGFTRRSRNLILNRGNTFSANISRVLFGSLETGAAVALVGLLMLIILGGASHIKILEPLQITAIDPSSIRAEAEAIDIQIQLTGLNYEESAVSESTLPSAEPRSSAAAAPVAEENEKEALSIDEALKILAE